MTKKKTKKHTHIHKLKRLDLTRNPDKKPYLVYACQQPGCNWYIAVMLAIGQVAECWICGDPFVIDKVSITHAKPHCNDCIKRKVKPEVEDLAKLVENI